MNGPSDSVSRPNNTIEVVSSLRLLLILFVHSRSATVFHGPVRSPQTATFPVQVQQEMMPLETERTERNGSKNIYLTYRRRWAFQLGITVDGGLVIVAEVVWWF
jgi:hypothetical protein